MEIVKFKDIKPAAYNPRRISETAFKELQGSLKTLGFILPIIVNKDNSVEELSKEQVRQIYTGELTSWSALTES